MGKAAPLARTGDKKVAAALRATPGGGWRSVVANTHGLPAGISCPGRTRVCAGPSSSLSTGELERIAMAGELAAGGRGRETTWRHLLPLHGIDPEFPCYVVSDLRHGTEENAAYRNWRLLRPALEDRSVLREHLRATLASFTEEAAAAGVEPLYRVHWDGDVPTVAYAEALALALGEFPQVRAWMYTRSLFAVPALSQVPNLVVYVSVDDGNLEEAAEVLTDHPGVKVAVLAADAAAAADVLSRLGRAPAPVCPVDSGKLPVVTAAGRAAVPDPSSVDGEEVAAVGACALCRLCVVGRGDVRFTLAKQRFTPKRVSRPAEFDAAAGWEHHFGRRPGPAALFASLLDSLGPVAAGQGASSSGATAQWRRTYVTVLVDDVVAFRAQARGTRLLLVLPHHPGTRLPRSARDIRGQRHQCPGEVEVTLGASSSARDVDTASRLVRTQLAGAPPARVAV